MAAAATADFSGLHALSGVLEQQRIVRTARAAGAAGDHLYAIRRPGRALWTRPGEVVAGPVVRFPITKRTDSRVYFHAYTLGNLAAIHYVDAARLARDGEAPMPGEGWPADFRNTFYAARETAEAIARGDIRQLRRQMASAHPDRGGTDGQFMAARKRYERALAAGRA